MTRSGRARRWLGRLTSALVVLVASGLVLWFAIHHVPWLGPALANGARRVVGPGPVARAEDYAYGLQDKYNRWRHGDDAPKTYWTAPAHRAPSPTSSSAASGKTEAAAIMPPKGFAPPFPQVASKVDGVWIPVDEALDEQHRPFMYKTMVHPDRERPYTVMAIIAIDLSKINLYAVPGTIEPRDPTLLPSQRPGTVPAKDRDSLIAAFNGGFQTIHGHYGMMVNGHKLGAPKPDACTVVIDQDGGLRVRSWQAISGTQDRMRAYRQTPHCLVELGKRHHDLDENAYNTHWGAVVGGKTVIRRSALGVSKDGRIMFFGLGDSLTARSLADGMMAAGSFNVAQLDVNHVFPRFVFFKHATKGKRRVYAATPLCGGFSFAPDDYVKEPMVRDFFYMTRRQGDAKIESHADAGTGGG